MKVVKVRFILKIVQIHRYKRAYYGIRRLSKVEKQIKLKLKTHDRKINKSYPGELFNIDTKRLPAIKSST